MEGFQEALTRNQLTADEFWDGVMKFIKRDEPLLTTPMSKAERKVKLVDSHGHREIESSQLFLEPKDFASLFPKEVSGCRFYRDIGKSKDVITFFYYPVITKPSKASMDKDHKAHVGKFNSAFNTYIGKIIKTFPLNQFQHSPAYVIHNNGEDVLAMKEQIIQHTCVSIVT